MLLIALATARELCAALPAAAAPAPGLPSPVRACGREAMALVTGVGPLCAALRLGRALERLGPEVDGVLHLGLAGSFDPAALPLGALAVVDRETWPEYGLRTNGGVDASGFDFPLLDGPRGPVRETIALDPDGAARAMGLDLPGAWPRAASLTVAGVSADADTAGALHARHGAALENMEGFALALACLEAGLPFLEVRAVSNAVGSRARADWDLRGALAALAEAVDALLGTAP